MREVIILILFLVGSSCSFCQVDEAKEVDVREGVRKTLLIKTAPLGYTNFFVRQVLAANLGVEYRMSDKWAIYFEGSFPSRTLKYFRPEVRLYLKEKRRSWRYASIEYSYMEQHFETSGSIGDGNAYCREYSMSKYLNTIKLKFGWHRQLGKSFSLDSFVGVGIRDRNGIVKGLTEEEIEDREIGSSERFFFLDTGRYYVPNLALGVRICFAIL